MEDSRLKIRTSEQTAKARTARKSNGLPWLLLGGGVLVLVGVFIVMLSSSEKPSEQQFAEVPEAKAIEKTLPEAVEPSVEEETIVDDGLSLWVSPTDGDPIELNYLLPGTQLIFHVRVADLLVHAEGEKVLAALGPWGKFAVAKIVRQTGTSLTEIETLLLGISPTRDGRLDYLLRIGLRSPNSLQPATDGRANFLPKEFEGKVLVNCPLSAKSALVAAGSGKLLLPRELQRVFQRTDEQRMATLVFAGKFLQISGEKFLPGSGEPLREALIDFLGDEATATALSVHWDENFFMELRSTVALDARPHRFAALLEQRVAASADQVEDVILSEPLHPYGRKVLARFPAMLRKLGNYTRSGEEEGLCLLRAYLPVAAGHNLVMGAELVVDTELVVGGATSRDASLSLGVGDISAVEGRGLARRLRQTTSLVFPKETLQRALEMLSDDIGVPLLIAGRDLQLEGITKNQSFGIDLREKPAAEILLAVLLRANPDRTANGPSDVKQKLVYVVREAEIVVTTRAAARRRGEKLPAVFEPATR